MFRIFSIFSVFSLLLLLSWTHASGVLAAPYGNYVEFSGGVIKSSTQAIPSPAGFSAETWILHNNTLGYRSILAIGDAKTGKTNYEIGLNASSLSTTIFYGNHSQVSVVAGNVPTNVWSHLGVSIDSNKIALFINGVMTHQSTGIIGLSLIGPDIVVGGLLTGSGSRFKGSLDDLRISKSSRNVLSNWSGGIYSGALISDSDTLLLWNLDGVRGQKNTADLSPNGINGLFSGSDSQIHFAGQAASLPPFSFPTIRWTRPILPTLTIPTSFPTPTQMARQFITIPFPGIDVFSRDVTSVPSYHLR